MSLVCSVYLFIHAFNANILDKDYAFSDGEILMVDNAVRTHLNLMSGILKKSDLMKIPLKISTMH
ncbi:AraC family transcriptional regulator [Escherichia coli]|nr:AraC family transcriptional regulator [Escherichia coli]